MYEYSFRIINPMAPELSAQCCQQKTEIYMAHRLLRTLLADDNSLCPVSSVLHCMHDDFKPSFHAKGLMQSERSRTWQASCLSIH